MKKVICLLIIAVIGSFSNLCAFSRSDLIGEWVQKKGSAVMAFIIKFNSDGTGCESAQSLFMDVDETKFSWTFSDGKIYFTYPNKKEYSNVTVIDSDNIEFGGASWVRRGSKAKSPQSSKAKSTQVNRPVQASRQATVVKPPKMQNPIYINSEQDFVDIFVHTFGYAENTLTAPISELTEYLKKHGIKYQIDTKSGREDVRVTDRHLLIYNTPFNISFLKPNSVIVLASEPFDSQGKCDKAMDDIVLSLNRVGVKTETGKMKCKGYNIMLRDGLHCSIYTYGNVIFIDMRN